MLELDKLAIKNQVRILFSGDLMENPNHIDPFELFNIKNTFNQLEASWVGISGNHDMTERYKEGLPTWVNCFPEVFKCIDLKSTYLDLKIKVHGIPFLRNNIGFEDEVKKIKIKKGEKNILLIHTEIPGAVDNNGFKADEVDNIPKMYSKLFKKFDLVIAGHIHKKQLIGKKILVPGAPTPQKSSDSEGEFGYWELYDDLSLKFIKIKGPQFKFYEEGDEIDDYNYWVKIPKKIKSKKKKKVIIKDNSKDKLAKAYLKHNGEYTKAKYKLLTKNLRTDE